MVRSFRPRLRFPALVATLLGVISAGSAGAQTPAATTARLHEVRAEAEKSLTTDQVMALSDLQIGSQVGKAELQAAADHLLQTGLFAKVNYSYQTKGEELTVTFQLEDSPRVPIYFDNLAWFGDDELQDVIRKKLPFFNGTLPEGGTVVDQATDAIKELLASRHLDVTLTHELLANPVGEGNVQAFRVEESPFRIASVEFSDPSATASHAVQQALADSVKGKPFSRMTVDMFLSEQLRPFYIQKGFLRVKLGPPEVHLTGDPNKKLPDELAVFVPVKTGPVYRWKDVQWTGNAVLSTITLTNDIGLKPGDVADGMQIEAAWDHIREDYGHRGYLDAKVEPAPSYDDQATTVSYTVSIVEGVEYHYNTLVLTGISLAGERRLKQMWPMADGAVFDKLAFEKLLTRLQTRPADVFGDLPLHYETVGHWLRTDASKHQVDVLLDFQ